ncbi:MAG: FMN-binding protein [Pseudomonadota bacterium]
MKKPVIPTSGQPTSLIVPSALMALTMIAQPAHAVQYLTLAQVQRVLYPSASEFKARDFLLTQTQRDAIAAAADVRVGNAHVHAWEARSAQGLLGYVLVDDVTGKHDAITYAVAISVQGKVQGVEIMDYRETYGGQIRDERWRAQFIGKGFADPLKLERDIKNISGATLSSSHVTDGVRRLVRTFEIAIKPSI